jgi:hypothetical protein
MRPIIEVRRLCHFKGVQEISRHFCRLRVSATVALKFSNNLALTHKVPLTFANVALDLAEVIEKHRPLHAR